MWVYEVWLGLGTCGLMCGCMRCGWVWVQCWVSGGTWGVARCEYLRCGWVWVDEVWLGVGR